MTSRLGRRVYVLAIEISLMQSWLSDLKISLFFFDIQYFIFGNLERKGQGCHS
ncbi:hypothetical protein ASZ90_020189 [hydrocarbon metagenome]|uniref:Uncharacterized protein n=1 Tax=hydrocarbon metagenome TaxID=938273 RepID=A0A0W8E1A3_9ZZZZ